MENATKALIIAGAILISILIIALGVMVYNNASGTVSSSDMTSTEIEAFNQKFLQYMSDNMSATEVTSLISAVQANNEAEYSSGSNRYIMLTVNQVSNGSGIYDVYGNNVNYTKSITVQTVSQSYTYSYVATYENGVIETITITPNNASTSTFSSRTSSSD